VERKLIITTSFAKFQSSVGKDQNYYPTGSVRLACEPSQVFSYYRSKKFEIATSEVGNPIKQDEKKGVLREVGNESSVLCVATFDHGANFDHHR
jgi:hypothetical protein